MILDNIVLKKMKSVRERKKTRPLNELIKDVKLLNNVKENKFREVFLEKEFSVIGEFKKASPSKGVIVKDFNLNNILKFYDEIAVDAFSILTEEEYFKGRDEYLKEIRKKSDKPILRKDFIIDEYQLYESRFLGADGVLLIVSILNNEVGRFYSIAKGIGLEPLVEVHNREELDIALNCGCEIIGINNRNLKNFETSLDITKELIKYIPEGKIIISESGIKSIDDLKFLKSLGVNGVLVGETFMRNMCNKEFVDFFKEFKYGN